MTPRISPNDQPFRRVRPLVGRFEETNVDAYERMVRPNPGPNVLMRADAELNLCRCGCLPRSHHPETGCCIPGCGCVAYRSRQEPERCGAPGCGRAVEPGQDDGSCKDHALSWIG